jgi:SAM-dependent methyltransferase
VSEPLFDKSAEYEEMLNRGLRLSGEDLHYFAVGRIGDLKKQLSGRPVRRILDFGCGIGHGTAHLAEAFPDAEVTGVDLAENALEYAREQYRRPSIRFLNLSGLGSSGAFDLCYVNGVFHHIEPPERREALLLIRDALEPGGYLALFENNPWNPGTRLVMSRTPFDCHAMPLSPPEALRLVREAGFRPAGPIRSLFYFPKVLRGLRSLEPALAHLPLGAQYYVLCQRV